MRKLLDELAKRDEHIGQFDLGTRGEYEGHLSGSVEPTRG